MRGFIIGLVILYTGYLQGGTATTNITFYSEQISIEYDSEDFLDLRPQSKERDFITFYKVMQQKEHIILNQLKAAKEKLELNDYLYYRLVDKTVQQIFVNKNTNYKKLTTWYYLLASGYDVRLTYLSNKVFLCVYSKEELFDVPVFTIGNKTFVNITAIDIKSNSTNIYLADFAPNRKGKPFSFSLKNLPKLKTERIKRKINFKHEKQAYQIAITVDKTIINILKNYPTISEADYLNVPLSSKTYQSIIKELSPLLKGKTKKETIQFLLSFTRSGFIYKEDQVIFGKSKPMIPEEVLFYSSSDCEDRSALFYFLASKLVGNSMVIVAYPNHLTIGVELTNNEGRLLHYKGRHYTLCDPTGPTNSSKIGIYPEGLERSSYQIIGSYQ